MTARRLTPREQLQAVFALLSSNKNLWTQGAYARDAQGRRIDDPFSPDAVCWCAQGALCKVSGISPGEVDSSDAYWAMRRAAMEQAGYSMSDIIHVNDHMGYGAVLAMLTKAMELCDESA